MSKPLRYPKNEELPEKCSRSERCEIIYPVRKYLSATHGATAVHGMPESIQLRYVEHFLEDLALAVQPVSIGSKAVE